MITEKMTCLPMLKRRVSLTGWLLTVSLPRNTLAMKFNESLPSSARRCAGRRSGLRLLFEQEETPVQVSSTHRDK